MNAERLHAVALALRAELDDTRTVPLLQQLLQSLQNMGAQPGQPAPQQEVANARQDLANRLSLAPSNDFSPAWREALDELGVTELLGNQLASTVEDVFAHNEVTPVAAAGELDPTVQKVNALDNALNQVNQSLGFFGVGADELSPGDFEVGFLVPRSAVDDALGGLGSELLKLQQRILGPFLEITTGSREDAKIKILSSSNFLIVLQSHPATAALLATAVERIIASYEKVMNIRLGYQKLKEGNASDATLKAVEAEAESKMESEIKIQVEELLADVKLEQGRLNELRKDFEQALNGIANRIDRGYTVEVRTAALPEPVEGEPEDPQAQQLRQAAEVVLERQQRLRFTNLSGTTILRLPEGSADDGDPDGQTATSH